MATTILTPDDVADLPRPRGVRAFELVHGRPLPLAALSKDDLRLRTHLVRLLSGHIIARRLNGTILSDAGFVLGLRREPERMRIADVAYVTRSTFDRHLEPDRALRCVPGLVIEVTSVVRKPDATQRLIDFLEAGAHVFWVLDPFNREALVYNRGEGARNVSASDIIDGAPALPGLRIHVGDLFLSR